MEKCRRRWDLADAEFLKYKYMNAFDRAMNHLDKAYSFSDNEHQYVSRKVLFGPYSEASGSHQQFAAFLLRAKCYQPSGMPVMPSCLGRTSRTAGSRKERWLIGDICVCSG